MPISSNVTNRGMAVLLWLVVSSEAQAATPHIASQSGSDVLIRPSENEIAPLYITCPRDAEIRINGRPVAGGGAVRWYPLWTGPKAQLLEVEARVPQSEVPLRHAVLVRPGQLNRVHFDSPVTESSQQPARAFRPKRSKRPAVAMCQAWKAFQTARNKLDEAHQRLVEHEKEP